MASLKEVYCKFGEASESAQLLEAELVNLVLFQGIIKEELFESTKEDFNKIDRCTIERLVRKLKFLGVINDEDIEKINIAREARNYLSHNFYRTHGYGRFSEVGRDKMLDDLIQTHWTIFEGYRFVMSLSNNDIPPLSEADDIYLKFVNN